MPEHREGTPAAYVLLESFLWRDFDTPAEWDAWVQARGLAARGLAPDAAAADAGAADGFAVARRLREALRALAAANTARSGEPHDARADADARADGPEGTPADVAAAVATLNALIADLGVQPVVAGDGGVALRGAPRAPAAGPAAAVLALALEAMRAGAWRRFKLCPEPSCRASFYDASKNASKAWCAMATCGSRHKMRRLRARQRR